MTSTEILQERVAIGRRSVALRQRLATDAAEQSLESYARQAWPVLEPNTSLSWSWHLGAICEYLTAVTRGQIRRLIINIPPRMTKSNLASVLWPTWDWIDNPARRWIFGSYSGKLSTKHSLDRRNVLASDWYRSRWGDRFALASDQNVKTEFENDRRGSMLATSVGGSVTGRGGDRIVIDDPHDPEEAVSDVMRQAAIDWYKYTISTRLDDPKTGALVCIMQRLHQEDLTGWLLSEQPGEWTHLKLPMESEGREVVHFPISKTEHLREDGELLHPERFGAPEVALLKLSLQSQAPGQLQQRPSAAEGGILKRHWWKRYDVLPAEPDECLTSWDLAFKDKKSSDYVVGGCFVRKGANLYLTDVVRGRMDFPTTCTAIRDFAVKHPEAAGHLVEDKANGPAVIATLKDEIPGLIEIEPEGGKESRANAAARPLEAGNIFLPSSATWVSAFIEECADFPNAKNDDQVDMFTQAVNRMLRGGNGWSKYFEQQLKEMANAA